MCNKTKQELEIQYSNKEILQNNCWAFFFCFQTQEKIILLHMFQNF